MVGVVGVGGTAFGLNEAADLSFTCWRTVHAHSLSYELSTWIKVMPLCCSSAMIWSPIVLQLEQVTFPPSTTFFSGSLIFGSPTTCGQDNSLAIRPFGLL